MNAAQPNSRKLCVAPATADAATLSWRAALASLVAII
jgi:hypothetical protein